MRIEISSTKGPTKKQTPRQSTAAPAQPQPIVQQNVAQKTLMRFHNQRVNAPYVTKISTLDIKGKTLNGFLLSKAISAGDLPPATYQSSRPQNIKSLLHRSRNAVNFTQLSSSTKTIKTAKPQSRNTIMRTTAY